MTDEENKEVVRRIMRAQEQGDAAEWVGLWAPNARNHGRPVTPHQLELLYTSLHAAFPDRHHEIHHLVAEGDLVISHITATGTFGDIPPLPVERVDFLASAPTGTSYSVRSVHIWRVADGKITEHWAVRDDLELLIQLGAIVPPPRPDSRP